MPGGVDKRHAQDFPSSQFKYRVIVSGILIGLGAAGLLDTIIFHQILQWHHMVSNVIPSDTADMVRFHVFVDGIFSAFSIVVISAGIALGLTLLSRDGHRILQSRYFAGIVLLGFGAFNSYDGIVNHLFLGIHHAIEIPNPLVADLTWLMTLGFAFVGIGAYLNRQKQTLSMDEAPAGAADT